LSGASIEVFGAVFMPDCESGGEGGAVVDMFGAKVAMGAGAGSGLLFEVSMLKGNSVWQ
jgi:hypothetical protein